MSSPPCATAAKVARFPVRRIIVVDNASTDSPLISLAQRFRDLDVVRLNHNSGFSAANNLGVRLAGDGDWIALLNPDAFPEPGWLEALMRASEAFRHYSCFASRMIQTGQPTVLDGAGDAYQVSGRIWRRG
jgi:GT2 family glycosyltransferase